MARRATRRATRRASRKGKRSFQLLSRIYAPVGFILNSTGKIVKGAANTAGNIVHSGFKGVSKIGKSVASGANKMVASGANKIVATVEHRTRRTRRKH